MTIHVKCPGCGAKFQAPENLAGKRVKCPKCSTAIAVAGQPGKAGGQAASPEHQTPMIPATCHCGKKLKVKAELAGKRVKCPAFGQAFTVADVQHAAAQPDGELDLGQLAGVEASAATTLGAPVYVLTPAFPEVPVIAIVQAHRWEEGQVVEIGDERGQQP